MKYIALSVAAFLGTIRSEEKGKDCTANADCTLTISF